MALALFAPEVLPRDVRRVVWHTTQNLSFAIARASQNDDAPVQSAPPSSISR